MIGSAASGKSTAVRILVQHLQAQDSRPIHYISSREIRDELYGNPHHRGPWAEVEAGIQRKLCVALSEGATAIVEACYVKRDFRLAITQALPLPEPVQWIGWWLDTPVGLCRQWNQQREHPVPDGVITKHCSQLMQAGPTPHRQEGFAQVVRLQTGQGIALEELIPAQLAALDHHIRQASNRDASHELHGYSSLLDQERLIFLIRLLSSQPKLTSTTSEAPGELGQQLRAHGQADLALVVSQELAVQHGACFGDPLAVAADLAWLEEQGFMAGATLACDGLSHRPLSPIEPPPWPAGKARSTGGFSRLADRQAFQQAFTVLRHLLHHPFDHAAGVRVHHHLASSLNQDANGGYSGWSARKVQAVITQTLTPYGFRMPGSSGRGGYAIGASLLSVPQLLEMWQLLELHANTLGFSSACQIRASIQDSLKRVGVELEQRPVARTLHWPYRTLGSTEAELEAAIERRQRVMITLRSRSGERSSPLQLWPLQLLLDRGSWLLLHEHDSIGQAEGLLACEPLASIRLIKSAARAGRHLSMHQAALARFSLLQQHCGSLHLGSDLAEQLAFTRTLAAGEQPARATLRFRCSPKVMAVVRQELERFLPCNLRLSRPLPGHSWGRTEPQQLVMTSDSDVLHPYPVELDLPEWVLRDDPELRRWIFSLGAGIRIEAPASLVEEQRRWLSDALRLYEPMAQISQKGELFKSDKGSTEPGFSSQGAVLRKRVVKPPISRPWGPVLGAPAKSP